MCGILGVVFGKNTIDDAMLAKAHENITYRGRDDRGKYRNRDIYLAHARLSIIDLDTGDQPMVDASGRYVIVFNGEIYNYLELRDNLIREGCIFRTNSDTEVLLQGFIHRGTLFFKSLEGMFAAAIWDCQARQLTLVRDPLGKKPLFVWQPASDYLAFASTIEAFKPLPGWQAKLNTLALSEFTRLGVVPAPLAIFRDTRKMQPGTAETFDLYKKNWTRQIFSHLLFEPYGHRIKNRDEAAGKLADALDRAFAIRTRADVPVGLLFSGGVDSGLLGCLAKEQGISLPFFNIDYEAQGDQSPERQNARLAARLLGADLIEDNFEPEALFLSLPEAYRYFDEPCSQLPLVYLNQILTLVRKRGIKVVLTGNGADELFFGYRGNERARLISDAIRWGLPWFPAGLAPDKLGDLKKMGWANFVYRNECEKLQSHAEQLSLASDIDHTGLNNYLNDLKNELERMNFQSYMDVSLWRKLKYNGAPANYILPDINGMQAQVEVRAPFLDWNLTQLALALADRHKIGRYWSNRQNKKILKQLYAQKLNKKLAYDIKRGMAWNIRWDMWIIHERQIHLFFKTTLEKLACFGIAPDWFIKQFNAYCQANTFAGAGGGQAVTGFMLAAWLIKEFEGIEALEKSAESIKGFKPKKAYGIP